MPVHVRLRSGAVLNATTTVDVADVGQIIPLVEYTALTGFFAGINQGDTLTIGDTVVSFDYGSGADDMISLTVIPEPATAATLVALVCLLAVIRWRRK